MFMYAPFVCLILLEMVYPLYCTLCIVPFVLYMFMYAPFVCFILLEMESKLVCEMYLHCVESIVRSAKSL